MNDDLLLLSGVQHFAFCKRQWALIHIEQQWMDNVRTVDGQLFHQRAHDETKVELRGDTLITRGMRVISEKMGITGVCDVVEFHKSEQGVPLAGYSDKWLVYPVEYKKGQPKENDADRLQLCCQAMCLEEMLIVPVPEGSLYYGETRRREKVVFTEGLRNKVIQTIREMNSYYVKGYTPKAEPSKQCNACSLKEVCLPKLAKKYKVSDYIKANLKEDI